MGCAGPAAEGKAASWLRSASAICRGGVKAGAATGSECGGGRGLANREDDGHGKGQGWGRGRHRQRVMRVTTG
jgi:hypothetical protein